MLVLSSTLYQFDVTVGHLSSLNYLLVSLFTFCICSHYPFILLFCSPYVSVRYCITFLVLHHKFSVTSLLLFLFLPFISQPCITKYANFCICLVHHYSLLFRCLHFYNLKFGSLHLTFI